MKTPADTLAAPAARMTPAEALAAIDADLGAMLTDQLHAMTVLRAVQVAADERAPLAELVADLNRQATALALDGAPQVNRFYVVPETRVDRLPTSHDDEPETTVVGWKVHVTTSTRERIVHVVEAAPRVRARVQAQRQAKRSTVSLPAPRRGARARGAGRPAVRRIRRGGDSGDDGSDSDEPPGVARPRRAGRRCRRLRRGGAA